MGESKKLLTKAEAQQIAEKFLLTKYFQSRVDFGDSQLIVKDDVQIHQLQGKITMSSRSLVDRFIIPKTANKYDFKIEIDAQEGQVLNYEFT
ncbi:MAG: hypothetical protein D4R82_05685 [Dehalococcoidia bacterium]|jgi:hypothetical protein|nr:MAG: hypothetical protein D4R82_05685 [Dehalococcoidia bacterium]